MEESDCEEDDAEEGEHSTVVPDADLDLSYILKWGPKHTQPCQSQEAPKAKPSPQLLPNNERSATSNSCIQEIDQDQRNKDSSSSHQHKAIA